MRRATPAKSIQNVYNSAYWHLARHDFSEYQLMQKLINKTDNAEWRNVVMTSLKERGEIDDEKYCQNYIESKVARGLGLARIKFELSFKKGISHEIIDTVLAELLTDLAPHLGAIRMAEKKFQTSWVLNDRKLTNKVWRYLSYRGHNSESIRAAIEALNQNFEET